MALNRAWEYWRPHEWFWGAEDVAEQGLGPSESHSLPTHPPFSLSVLCVPLLPQAFLSAVICLVCEVPKAKGVSSIGGDPCFCLGFLLCLIPLTHKHCLCLGFLPFSSLNPVFFSLPSGSSPPFCSLWLSLLPRTTRAGGLLTTMRFMETQQSEGKSCSIGTRNCRQPSQ